VVKKPLLDNVDNGTEADAESEEDAPATLVMEPIIAYLGSPECNNPAKNDGEWVINENVAFDYSLCLDHAFNSVDTSSLHMPLPISEMACRHIKDGEGSVFVTPSSKRDQLL